MFISHGTLINVVDIASAWRWQSFLSSAWFIVTLFKKFRIFVNSKVKTLKNLSPELQKKAAELLLQGAGRTISFHGPGGHGQANSDLDV